MDKDGRAIRPPSLRSIVATQRERIEDLERNGPVRVFRPPKPRAPGIPTYAARPTNKTEAQCWDWLMKNGYRPDNKGWPDILAFKGKEGIAIEVKPSNPNELSQSQRRTMRFLADHGIKTFVWTPSTGLLPFPIS